MVIANIKYYPYIAEKYFLNTVIIHFKLLILIGLGNHFYNDFCLFVYLSVSSESMWTLRSPSSDTVDFVGGSFTLVVSLLFQQGHLQHAACMTCLLMALTATVSTLPPVSRVPHETLFIFTME